MHKELAQHSFSEHAYPPTAHDELCECTIFKAAMDFVIRIHVMATRCMYSTLHSITCTHFDWNTHVSAINHVQEYLVCVVKLARYESYLCTVTLIAICTGRHVVYTGREKLQKRCGPHAVIHVDIQSCKTTVHEQS
jgi:hypothetical protein